MSVPLVGPVVVVTIDLSPVAVVDGREQCVYYFCSMESKSEIGVLSFLSRWKLARRNAVYREFYDRMRHKFTLRTSGLQFGTNRLAGKTLMMKAARVLGLP